MEQERIILRGKLGPGQLLSVNTSRGLILENDALKAELAARQPYGAWVRTHLRTPRELSTPKLNAQRSMLNLSEGGLQSTLQQQAAFGYTNEELVMVIRPMVEEGAEALGSMGDDTPPAVLSDKPRPLFGYFRQRFAEVTTA